MDALWDALSVVGALWTASGMLFSGTLFTRENPTKIALQHKKNHFHRKAHIFAGGKSVMVAFSAKIGHFPQKISTAILLAPSKARSLREKHARTLFTWDALREALL